MNQIPLEPIRVASACSDLAPGDPSAFQPSALQSFLTELLAEQQRLDTPVARFSSLHDQYAGSGAGTFAPQLIPLSAPGPGQQYAFEVDLDACTGCKSCVAACHSLNGLDENETWRDVGLLVSSRRARPFTQTVTSACHHCADPACLNGCPVLAYEKDPLTGIVRHLDDQCIGCSYCILKCPYDVPKFSERLGIVRKCDMCHGRLAAGEAPACAQACPTEAIRITTINIEPAPSTSRTFLPACPDPSYTQPTTRYVSARSLPDHLVAADATALRPQPAHWPLVVMLTLTPAAVALSAVAAIAPAAPVFFSAPGAARLAVILGVLGAAASVLHLGQPQRAWRIFLGWRKSWLSREAILFGTWLPTAVSSVFLPALAGAAAALGAAALGCSAMIYIDTRRHFWRAGQSFPRILGTAMVIATALVAPPAGALLLMVKLGCETRTWFDRTVSARLQRGPLAAAVLIRDSLAISALVLLIAAPGWPALAALVGGEMAERYLFFRAVDAPKMPGMPTA